MKKLISAIVLSSIFFLTACSGQSAKNQVPSGQTTSSRPAISSASSASPPASQNSAVSSGAKEDIIAGNVNDATMNTLQIMTADGHMFTFSTMDVAMEAPAEGITVGDDATVYYTGTLDESKATQDVTVTKIVVTHVAK